jgi:hypothetical protein
VNPNNVKSFKTAARKKKDKDEATVTFEVDGTEFTATRPKDSVFAFLAATADDPGKGMVEVTRFLDACFPATQRKILSDRLRDPDDSFDVEDLVDIFEYVVSEFTDGTPTES